jgi:predicted phage terminase large subunit-like protein
MLNERILDKTRYNNLIQTIGEDIVRANYDQEPIDLKGRLYGEFITYKEKPQFKGIYSICDTADEGKDYLCNIIYGLTHASEPKAYILDVYYTRENMDITERKLAQLYMDYEVQQAVFESNFGGKAFAKVIEKLSREKGNNRTQFQTFTQNLNKEARILANATNVVRNIYMPEHWDRLFKEFYRDVTEFQRTGGNKNDDGPDTLTMISEKISKPKGIVTSNVRIF